MSAETSKPHITGITAIVPAYNEAGRIEHVLEVLQATDSIADIIVVDDGSTDGTRDILQPFAVKKIYNEKRLGKAAAMDRAMELVTTEYVFFCDADIIGLTADVIRTIIEPVHRGEVDMSIGMINRRIPNLNRILRFVPLLGGLRAMRVSLWHTVPQLYKQSFKIEAALNFYAMYYGRGYHWEVHPELSQTIKEKKYGLLRGVIERIGMCIDVASALISLFHEGLKVRIRLAYQRFTGI